MLVTGDVQSVPSSGSAGKPFAPMPSLETNLLETCHFAFHSPDARTRCHHHHRVQHPILNALQLIQTMAAQQRPYQRHRLTKHQFSKQL